MIENTCENIGLIMFNHANPINDLTCVCVLCEVVMNIPPLGVAPLPLAGCVGKMKSVSNPSRCIELTKKRPPVGPLATSNRCVGAWVEDAEARVNHPKNGIVQVLF